MILITILRRKKMIPFTEEAVKKTTVRVVVGCVEIQVITVLLCCFKCKLLFAFDENMFS
jgi:hypothetical protein